MSKFFSNSKGKALIASVVLAFVLTLCLPVSFSVANQIGEVGTTSTYVAYADEEQSSDFDMRDQHIEDTSKESDEEPVFDNEEMTVFGIPTLQFGLICGGVAALIMFAFLKLSGRVDKK